MKKFTILSILIIMLIMVAPTCNYVSFAESQKIIINTDFSYLYKQPSFENYYEIEIEQGEILDCLNIKDNFYEVQYEFNENLLTGYIPYEFASVYKPEQEVILSYNAKIISQTDVYSITNGSIIDDIKLSPGHQIYIYESFDSKAEFTKAKFKYNNQVVIANIPTTNLSPNGLNKGVIIALSIISALVGVVLILLGLKKKKKKKLGTKN